MGSPTRRREGFWIIGGLVGNALLLVFISILRSQGVIDGEHIKYAFLTVVVWKLTVTYALYNLQNHTIELYEYYGGKLQNGLLVIVAAHFVSPRVLDLFSPVFRIILG